MENLRTTVKTSTSATSIYMSHVYQWMTAGLATTGAVSWYAAGSEQLMNMIYTNTLGLIILAVATIGMAIGLQSMIGRLSAAAATLWFLAYSGLMGVFLAPVFLVYTGSSIAKTFFVAAGTFGAMSVYGMVTKKDLTGWGNFLMMGLLGIIIASVVNIFFKSTGLEFVISAIGVIIFTGLTAYDTQKIRNFGENAPLDDSTALRRGAILGALTLYLDFINLFLMMLRLFGDRR